MNSPVNLFTPDHKKTHRDSTGSTHESSKLLSTGRSPEEKPPRRTSLQVVLSNLSNSDRNHPKSPSPSLLSPNSAADSPQMSDPMGSGDKSPHGGSKLTRKESYKAQRKSYRQEKKRVADELLSSLKDPTVIVLADWLKVRGSLKSWTKLYCILKPGLLLLYKSTKIKSNHWVGTVLLNACQVIERPSKKDGFCFKLFHPLEQSIWAPKGPEKETIGAVVQPLPTSYLIFRAPSQAAGKCWLDALELSLRCSSLLVRSISRQDPGEHEQNSHDTQWSEADFEKHFVDHEKFISQLQAFLPGSPNTPQRKLLAQCRSTPSPSGLQGRIVPPCQSPCPSPTPLFPNLYHALSDMEKCIRLNRATPSDTCQTTSSPSVPLPIPFVEPDSSCITLTDLDGGGQDQASGADISVSETESEASARCEDIVDIVEHEIPETPYIARVEGEIGAQGEQVEELAEEHKSLIWFLVKQVRPGMDLSKVVLPTFILEPRSFLDKLSDSYYHADILSKAVLEDDAFTRMKTVVQWYLSGFYKKPKGLKKPYNPVLGETFRCYWKHPNGSRTFYIAEQVSHHPPVSAFFVTNRQDGFCISGSILAKSKFYGNSTSAILDGVGILTLLPRGEEYSITVPYALCKGILMGTLTMELGGKVAIECEKTGYKTELEFKLKPLIGGSDNINGISGKLKLGKETLATIDGYWDGVINIRDKRTGEEQILFNATSNIRAARLVRYTVPIPEQTEFESERLWEKVSLAIAADDQVKATEEKTTLEDAQREAVKVRKRSCTEWTPRLFEQNLITGAWEYKHCDLRPWDPRNDLLQFESNFVMATKTRHRTPMIRTSSIISVEHPTVQPLLQAEARSSLSVLKSSKRRMTSGKKRQESVSSSQEAHSDSSQWEDSKAVTKNVRRADRLQEIVQNVEEALQINSDRLQKLQSSLEQVARAQRERDRRAERSTLSVLQAETFLVIAIISLFQLLLVWIFFRRG